MYYIERTPKKTGEAWEQGYRTCT